MSAGSRRRLHNRVIERALRMLPPKLAGTLDLLRPSVKGGFGGPFNAQARRIEAVRDIFSSIQFRTIVETGTYRATTTLFLRTLTDAPIATIEADPRFFHYSRIRLRSTDITVLHGDSASVLGSLARDRRWHASPAFFYLDAHWRDALPLPDEIRTIAASWNDFVVLVDDFRVAGDAGYGYDDYGDRGTLDVDLLLHNVPGNIVVYWPSAGSNSETGARRGWVVLSSPGLMDDALRTLLTVRRGGNLDALPR